MATTLGSTKKLPSVAEGFPTPPHYTLDTFSRMDVEQKTKVAPVQTPLSPVSPAQDSMPNFASSASYLVPDEPLYPDNDRSQAAYSQTPLFTNVDASSTSSSTRSDSTSAPHARSPATPPASRQNLGSIIGPTVYIENSPEGVWQYYSDRMAELDRIRQLRGCMLPQPVVSAAAKLDPISTRQLQSLGKPTGIIKTRSPPKVTVRPKSVRAASPVKAPLPPKRTPKTSALQDFQDSAFPSSQSPKHKRAAPTKKAFTNDSEWRTFEDFCPPLTSLDSADKPLKAGWNKSSPMDLSQDVDQDELHPAEYAVAAELRLHPVQYLANKRRIFSERVRRLKEGQGFTKTAAQNVCNIDVNKVSKLWEAFYRVGWFEEKWFEKYV